MAQLSPPFRIALVGLLVVAALWFTVLKPKDPAAEPVATAPGTAGLATATDAAKGAASASDASASATQAAAGSAGTATTATGSASTGSAAPKAATANSAGKAAATAGSNDLSAPLLSALDRKRAVVLLFWNSRASDDAAVRDAVRSVDRRGGRAVVKVAAIKDVGRYQAITRGVQVLTSPTVLVISPDHTARAITGLTTSAELDQMVGDTLAAARKAKG
ncbi:MAG: hypothetical protein QOD73_991 [Solirubrobacteraceae bacterium]|nr:hypothetical protein [Solirubrobacteraceae bacterium]